VGVLSPVGLILGILLPFVFAGAEEESGAICTRFSTFGKSTNNSTSGMLMSKEVLSEPDLEEFSDFVTPIKDGISGSL
jgi:hypothetical protein